MNTVYLFVDALTLFFVGYLFLVYLCRAFRGEPVAKKDNGKAVFALDLAVVTLVFVTFLLDALINDLQSLVNFLGA